MKYNAKKLKEENWQILPKPSAPIVKPNHQLGRQSAGRSSNSKRSLNLGSTGRRSASSRLAHRNQALQREGTIVIQPYLREDLDTKKCQKDFSQNFKESKQIES